MLTNPQTDTSNDSDLLSSISESNSWQIPPSLAKCMESRIFREFLAKIKEKKDEKAIRL